MVDAESALSGPQKQLGRAEEASNSRMHPADPTANGVDGPVLRPHGEQGMPLRLAKMPAAGLGVISGPRVRPRSFSSEWAGARPGLQPREEKGPA